MGAAKKTYTFKVMMNFKKRNGEDLFRTITWFGENIEAAFNALKNDFCGRKIEGSYIEGKELVISDKPCSLQFLGGETQDNINIECEANNCDSIVEVGGFNKKTVYYASK